MIFLVQGSCAPLRNRNIVYKTQPCADGRYPAGTAITEQCRIGWSAGPVTRKCRASGEWYYSGLGVACSAGTCC